MSNRLRFSVAAFFHFGAVSLLAAPSLAATWQNKVSYGGSTTMDLYVPTTVDASPGVVVALHYCGGNSSNAHGWLQSASDQYGFIIIAPSAGGNCFDATPARSGERDAITKMVAYVVTQNHADPTKVFAAGASSGACMTQALLAAYPEVFAGGSVLAGVPAGAWTGGNAYGWTTPANRAAAEWGDIVRKASPSFTGTRPKVQLWHGTGDTTLTYTPNFPAEVSQWTNVHGVTDSTTSSFKASQDTWERKSYKNSAGALVIETNVAQGAPHDLSGRGLWPDVVRFFGLDVDTPTGGGGSGAGGGASAGGASVGGSGGVSGAGASTAGTGGIVASAGSVSAAAGLAGTSGGTGGGGSPGSTTGGSAAVAGSPSSTTGGTSSVAGAASSGAGAPTTGAAGGSSSDDGGGCSVYVGAARPRVALVGLLLAGLGAVLRRRRRAPA